MTTRWDFHTNRAYYAAHAAEDRDRAVIARRKGNERRHIAAIAGTIEYVQHKPDPNDGRLPESAFDWPIYRAALYGGRNLLDPDDTWTEPNDG